MPFAFKKFSIADDRCQMKVGTDGVLLGAWVGIQEAGYALDIGTGCGLIALMLAQRNRDLHIDAVEILAADAEQASENIKASPWADRIEVHLKPIQEFGNTRRYDLIVTNPPFFVGSTLSPERGRASVRHTMSLSHAELLAAVSRLLQPTGRFAIILPSAGFETFNKQAEETSLFPRRVLAFQTRPGRPPERHLVEYTPHPGPRIDETMFLYIAAFQNGWDDRWSDAYRSLVSDFYL